MSIKVGKYRDLYPLSLATSTCLRNYELRLKYVLQHHTVNWNIFAHTGKHYNSWINSGNYGVVKGNALFVLYGAIEKVVIDGMAK